MSVYMSKVDSYLKAREVIYGTNPITQKIDAYTRKDRKFYEAIGKRFLGKAGEDPSILYTGQTDHETRELIQDSLAKLLTWQRDNLNASSGRTYIQKLKKLIRYNTLGRICPYLDIWLNRQEAGAKKVLGEGRGRSLTQSLLIWLLGYVTYTIRPRKLKS